MTLDFLPQMGNLMSAGEWKSLVSFLFSAFKVENSKGTTEGEDGLSSGMIDRQDKERVNLAEWFILYIQVQEPPSFVAPFCS